MSAPTIDECMAAAHKIYADLWLAEHPPAELTAAA